MLLSKCVLIIHTVLVIFLCGIKADLLDDEFSILYSNDIQCEHSKHLNLDASNTYIYFYDFKNNINISSRIDAAVEVIRNETELDLNRHLVIFVPGYKCNIQRNLEELIRQTFKEVSKTYLIIVDHSAYTYENQEKIKSYLRSVRHSYYIGAALGQFLADLTDVGFLTDNIQCVGHSLGSHIIGYAAEMYANIKKNQLPIITGLDPAGPCFANGPIEEHIRSGTAKYVEVFHCNAGHLGTTRTLADADFFFNYEGKIQPNCDKGSNLAETVKCYHKACVSYWAKTVHHPELYEAKSCSTYKAFAQGLCDSNESTMAGYHHSAVAKGKYYISTERVP